MSSATETPFARLLRVVAKVEPLRGQSGVRLLCVFLLPVWRAISSCGRCATRWGRSMASSHLQELFTGTFLASFIVAPVYAGLASRIRLVDLPALGLWLHRPHHGRLLFRCSRAHANNRWIAAAFYVWLSTFNLLTISVFWSMMADIFSQHPGQAAVRLHRRGRHRRHHRRAGLYRAFRQSSGHQHPAADFGGRLCDHRAAGARAGKREAQAAALAIRRRSKPAWIKSLGGNPFDGFVLLFKSRYLLDDRAVPAADDLDFDRDLFPARRSDQQGIRQPGRRAPRPTPPSIWRPTPSRC